jgi:hypothetical protein
LIVKRNEIIEIERELTPTARFAIRAFLHRRMNRD